MRNARWSRAGRLSRLSRLNVLLNTALEHSSEYERQSGPGHAVRLKISSKSFTIVFADAGAQNPAVLPRDLRDATLDSPVVRHKAPIPRPRRTRSAANQPSQATLTAGCFIAVAVTVAAVR